MIDINKQEVSQALKSMQSFMVDLRDLYHKHGMDFDSNLGRRNIMMSAAQEHFFVEAFKRSFPDAVSDGKTGRPDIHLAEGRELECKLTSPTKNGGINLQTDWDTLQKKSNLDYLYVIVDHDFKKFNVLYFELLDSSDYYPPSATSRGRAKMKKFNAMKKCHILWGDVIDGREKDLKNAREALAATSDRAQKTRNKLEERIVKLEQSDSYYSFVLEPVC